MQTSSLYTIVLLLLGTMNYLKQDQHVQYSIKHVNQSLSLLKFTTNYQAIKTHHNSIVC